MKNLITTIGPIEISILGIGAGALKYAQNAENFLNPSLPEKSLILIGSISKLPRNGNTGGNFYFQGKPFGLPFDINKFGLPNAGIDAMRNFLKDFIIRAHEMGYLVGVNVVGFSPEEYVYVINALIQLSIDYVEINAGCANAIGEGGERKEVLFYNLPLLDKTLGAIYQIVRHIPEEKRPAFGLKGSAILQENLIWETINVLNKHTYLDSLVMINTIANTTYYDSEQKPVIGIDGLGGLSAEAMLPISLGQLVMWNQYLTDMKSDLALTGVGGVKNANDLKAMLARGASNVQLVSHFNNSNCDPGIFPQILADYLELPG